MANHLHPLSAAVLMLLTCAQLYAQPRRQDPVGTVYPAANTPVHDPVIMEQQGKYYIFSTGMGINVYSSTNLTGWTKEPPVFAQPPQWAVDAVPTYRGHTWAPDISFYNGMYHLYYSVSAFGKNTSCIGLAINKTLDATSPNFGWQDLGPVIQSIPGRDNWNAIDPNFITDEAGNPWLVFGSFWGGIKLTRLQPNGRALSQPQEWYTLASKPDNSAIEAPFIFKHNDYYYLFVSWDFCCRGAQSTYKIVVGRSKNLTGSYLDKSGTQMALGGGSLVVQGDGKKWHGVGHNAAYTIHGQDYLVYHGYDAADSGKSKLIIKPMQWDADGWPAVKQ